MKKSKTRIVRVSENFYNVGKSLAIKNNRTFTEIADMMANVAKEMNGKKRGFIDEIEF